MRVVIELKARRNSGSHPQQLFKQTQLQDTFGIKHGGAARRAARAS